METKYPELGARIQSSFIDMIFLIVMMFAFSAILDRLADPPDWLRILMFGAVFILYEPCCTAFGCTIGNYVKSIRVRRVSDTNHRINIFQAIIRYVVKVALGWLSFLTIHQNAERRAIHDLLAGSVMINVEN